MTTIRLLAPHLTAENHQDLLAAASGKSRREAEELLARRFPHPPVPASVRKLPEARSSVALSPPLAAAADQSRVLTSPTPVLAPATLPLPSRPAVVASLAPDHYKVTFTATAETCRKLRLAQDLLRHQIPNGNPAEIFDRALAALLEDLARKKLGASNRPRSGRGAAPGSRRIPAQVKRAVWLRDGGRCAFLATNGRRCSERGFLEFHHVEPHAAGGEATVGNIALRCRPHNVYEAELHFGPWKPLGGEGIARESPARYGATRLETSWVAATGPP